MLRIILINSWEQAIIKHQLYAHSFPNSQIIQKICQTCWAWLGKKRWSHEQRSLMDSYMWLLCKDLNVSSLCWHWIQSRLNVRKDKRLWPMNWKSEGKPCNQQELRWRLSWWYRYSWNWVQNHLYLIRILEIMQMCGKILLSIGIITCNCVTVYMLLNLLER